MPVPCRFTLGWSLLLLGRLGLGGTFLYAASTKLHPPVSLSLSFFAMQVDSYRLLPSWAVSPFAHTLPWVELALGLLLLTGWQLRYVASATSTLLMVFSGIMLRAYAMGLEISCGCFGPGETLGVKTLVRDGSLLAVSLVVTVAAFLAGRKRSERIAVAPESQKAG